MKERTAYRIFLVASFVTGFALLAWVDPRIALGVLMTHWANNMNNELRGMKP